MINYFSLKIISSKYKRGGAINYFSLKKQKKKKSMFHQLFPEVLIAFHFKFHVTFELEPEMPVVNVHPHSSKPLDDGLV